MIRKILMMILMGCLLLSAGCGDHELIVTAPENESFEQELEVGPETAAVTAAATETEQEMLYVHVCGAVRDPGVYVLPAGSRCYEAIEMAGGLREDAESSFLNLASPLSDGMQLRVPTSEEVSAGMADQVGTGQQVTGESGNFGLVNINTADAAALCKLPGIGETRAKQIVAYREAHGAFASPEEIMNVTGIKSGLYEQIKDLICI